MFFAAAADGASRPILLLCHATSEVTQFERTVLEHQHLPGSLPNPASHCGAFLEERSHAEAPLGHSACYFGNDGVRRLRDHDHLFHPGVARDLTRVRFA